ncbi:unnamed protein product [Parnassius apollo]|uniref:(apollo) hypothetical protein n=1 Tax=Parnassius apollo TaxID=110799 RepID=A0A8S3WLL2_PARAO|nr:unnamed protein product [Parnassius apollo]
MLSAARYVAKENKLPTPVDVGVTYKSEDVDDVSRPPPLLMESKQIVTFEGTGFECSLHDLTKMIHYIYDLFSTDYQYDLIRSVFTSTPEYQLIDTPHQIRHPKRLYTQLKVKPKDVSKKQQKTSRGKNKEVETKEYLHLLQLQSDLEREIEEQEEKEREEWNRRNHVLPLAFAVKEEFFDKYWPPPTSETVPESEPEARGKGKTKKK